MPKQDGDVRGTHQLAHVCHRLALERVHEHMADARAGCLHNVRQAVMKVVSDQRVHPRSQVEGRKWQRRPT